MTAEEWLKQEFPALQWNYFEITSPPTTRYNCIAWAAGKDDKWWWPIQGYWPGQHHQDESVGAFKTAFAKFGYASSDNDSHETGIEKVAIYVGLSGLVTHMARQLGDGRWTSKLGNGVDIAHTLEGISGPRYGKVAMILARQVRPAVSS